MMLTFRLSLCRLVTVLSKPSVPPEDQGEWLYTYSINRGMAISVSLH